jgi:diaminopimelate epimerase
VRLTKHHGLGNDFLIAFVTDVPHDAPAQARRLCHRTEGIGADGLIFLAAGEPGVSDVTMTLLNADGSLAEVSGNGLRCVAQALTRRDGVETGDYVVDTISGDHAVAVRSVNGAVADVAAEMGVVTVIDEARATRLVAELTEATKVGAALIGNPHVVALVANPNSIDLATVGRSAEDAIEGGTNVEFIRPVPDVVDAIELTVWERGAGATRACGSGACVAAWFANQWGLVGEVVEVVMPGGRATVHLSDGVTLVGPATHIADIEVA